MRRRRRYGSRQHRSVLQLRTAARRRHFISHFICLSPHPPTLVQVKLAAGLADGERVRGFHEPDHLERGNLERGVPPPLQVACADRASVAPGARIAALDFVLNVSNCCMCVVILQPSSERFEIRSTLLLDGVSSLDFGPASPRGFFLWYALIFLPGPAFKEGLIRTPGPKRGGRTDFEK